MFHVTPPYLTVFVPIIVPQKYFTVTPGAMDGALVLANWCFFTVTPGAMDGALVLANWCFCFSGTATLF